MADDPIKVDNKDTEETLAASGITIDRQQEMSVESSSTSKQEKGENDLPRIRTYAADMNAAIEKRGATLASIVSEEKAAAEKKPKAAVPQKEKRRTLILFIATFVLLFVGTGAIVTTIFLNQRQEAEDIRKTSIISPNNVTRVELQGGVPLAETLATIRTDANLSLGEMLRVDVMNAGRFATPQEILSALNVPESLRREVTDVMVGVHAFDRNQPFIIMSVSAYDRSFSAFLSWESEVGRAFDDFFAPLGARGNPPFLSFSDVIVQNIDIRKSQTEWPVLYGYATRSVLIITTNEFTLREILSRLASVRP